MRVNSKPLRWDEAGPVSLNTVWGFMIGCGTTEAMARTVILRHLGEVDEQFIHVLLGPRSQPDVSYMIISRSETDGRSTFTNPFLRHQEYQGESGHE